MTCDLREPRRMSAGVFNWHHELMDDLQTKGLSIKLNASGLPDVPSW
jgi:hypothetical protein